MKLAFRRKKVHNWCLVQTRCWTNSCHPILYHVSQLSQERWMLQHLNTSQHQYCCETFQTTWKTAQKVLNLRQIKFTFNHAIPSFMQYTPLIPKNSKIHYKIKSPNFSQVIFRYALHVGTSKNRCHDKLPCHWNFTTFWSVLDI